MFNIGPMEFLVLAIVGLVVIGPEKLPGLARDAAHMLRTLRDLATGARQQLRDELGPEFADVDLRSLNPRTAMQRMVFGEDSEFSSLSPRNALRDAILGDDDLRAADPRTSLREAKASYYDADPAPREAPVSFSKPTSGPNPGQARPRPRPRPTYGDDVT
jgi:sec-independent protein translocase protein TatB